MSLESENEGREDRDRGIVDYSRRDHWSDTYDYGYDRAWEARDREIAEENNERRERDEHNRRIQTETSNYDTELNKVGCVWVLIIAGLIWLSYAIDVPIISLITICLLGTIIFGCIKLFITRKEFINKIKREFRRGYSEGMKR